MLPQLRFILALLMALMMKDHGFSMIATVCSTWVFVNRATSLGVVGIPIKDFIVCSLAPKTKRDSVQGYSPFRVDVVLGNI